MSAFCWSTLQLLSSSGSLRLCNTTISDEVQEPASVLIFLLLEFLPVWQFTGRRFLLIMVVVEPESSKTFSKILDFTEEVVSTTMIVTGESCFGIFLLISIASLALICSKLIYTSSAKMQHTRYVLVLFGAFPVESVLEIIPEMSVFCNLDNSLLFCNHMSVLVLYSKIPRLFVLLILKGSTGANRHLSKLNGLVTSSGHLRAASKKSSPIKTVSVKLRSLSINVGDASLFLPL